MKPSGEENPPTGNHPRASAVFPQAMNHTNVIIIHTSKTAVLNAAHCPLTAANLIIGRGVGGGVIGVPVVEAEVGVSGEELLPAGKVRCEVLNL